MMIISLAVVLLLPTNIIATTSSLKLHKTQLTTLDPQREAAYLALKYGSSNPQLVGAGGSGRKLRFDQGFYPREESEELYWIQQSGQEVLHGGHKVPLSSAYC